MDRFWSKVDKTPGHGPNGDCRIWTGGSRGNGYGAIGVNKKVIDTHRFSFLLECGISSLPSTLDVCHRCDFRLCVNPDHLFLGTRQDNVLDMFEKGRGSLEQLKGSGERRRKIGPVGTAWCSKHQEFLQVDNFYSNKSHWNGLGSDCKECSNLKERRGRV